MSIGLIVEVTHIKREVLVDNSHTVSSKDLVVGQVENDNYGMLFCEKEGVANIVEDEHRRLAGYLGRGMKVMNDNTWIDSKKLRVAHSGQSYMELTVFGSVAEFAACISDYASMEAN